MLMNHMALHQAVKKDVTQGRGRHRHRPYTRRCWQSAVVRLTVVLSFQAEGTASGSVCVVSASSEPPVRTITAGTLGRMQPRFPGMIVRLTALDHVVQPAHLVVVPPRLPKLPQRCKEVVRLGWHWVLSAGRLEGALLQRGVRGVAVVRPDR